MYNLNEISRFWNLGPVRLRPDIEMAGSPERSLFRTVLETEDSRLWVLEQIAPALQNHKLQIIRTLAYLENQGLTGIQTFHAGDGGNYFLKTGDTLWQLVPFVEGCPLKRPEYVSDRWRGHVLARFLLDFRQKAENIPGFDRSRSFSIKAYISDFMNRLDRHHPEHRERIMPVLDFLETDFMNVHDSLPVAFCHGDIHPLNVIWGEKRLRAVIDWEFLGYKPGIYDLANLIGCIGMEDPDGLLDEMEEELLGTLLQAGYLSAPERRYLPEFVIAIRFAWLAEWLRKKDDEMIELETVYMNLLLKHRDTLRQHWNL